MLSIVPPRKPAGRAYGVDFGVPEDALASDELREEVIETFAQIPAAQRQRVVEALRIIAAAPATERLRAVNDVERIALGGRRQAPHFTISA